MITPLSNEFTWHKSSHSTGQGGNCVEAGINWRRSSHSGGTGGNCVEMGSTPRSVGVRDTKNRDLGHLAVPPAAWRTFVSALRRGGAPHPHR